jgi:adenylyltransferase/sulfurtransferase
VAGGVLGVLPGIIGSIQASEAIKLILAAGETLSGRLLLFDGLRTSFREIAVTRSSTCPVCGDNPQITTPIDYETFCGEQALTVPEISATELSARLTSDDAPLVIDVREPYESRISTIGGVLIPLGQLEGRIADIARDRDIVLYCRSGVRSALATKMLLDAGFKNVVSLRGGVYAWSDDVDDTVAKY